MKLKKQFADFYKEIKIDEEVEDLKEKREVLQGDIENKLPNELKKHGIDLKKSELKNFLTRVAINLIQQFQMIMEV